jgi:SAM-dependent methyltransferase
MSLLAKDCLPGRSPSCAVRHEKVESLRGRASAGYNFAQASTREEEIDPMGSNNDRSESSRKVFESNRLYTVSNICRAEDRQANDYVGRLLAAKLQTVRRHLRAGLLVDLCCATGEHIWSVKRPDTPTIGVDFSTVFLANAESRRRLQAIPDVTFIAADARSLPLAPSSVTTLYSLSALYVIPDTARVIAEVSRVLRRRGRCVLDLGNSRSLNSYCVRNFYPELPKSHHMRVRAMERLCADHGLRIIEHRSFQILPLWAGRPRWLWPLLHPRWKTVMSKIFAGRMIDEWLSSLPLLRNFAFRHVLVCEKC